MNLFEKITRKMVDDEWGDMVKKIIDNPNNAEVLFFLAFKLYEEKVYDIAATLLIIANEIRPHNSKIIQELIVNLFL